MYFYFFCFTFISIQLTAQNSDFKINETIVSKLPQSIKIIGLGDPTHQESTITKIRINLIKKLVEEHQFKIIAIEGNMYELYNGFQKFKKLKDISFLENGMYNQLNFLEMEELYDFVLDKNQKGDSIIITGFDAAFSGNTFVQNMKNDLRDICFLNDEEKEDFLKQLTKANNNNIGAIFRNNKKVKSKIVYYSKKIISNFSPKIESEYFFVQALKNIIFLYDENKSENTDNLRDIGMLNNISFLKEMYKNQKIVLFGSSTHLLKSPDDINSSFFQNNRKTLGKMLTKKYENNYYYIAYSAISGMQSNMLNKPKKLSQSHEKSIEHKYQYINSEIFLNKDISDVGKTYSRFLGHSFLEINIWEVMDALVLIKNVKPAIIKSK